jgi:sugar/nucleoside kinase (ribokinase family)
MKNYHSKAIVAGHICLDIIPNLQDVPAGKFFDLFQPGLMLQIGPPQFSTGGPVSNTGLALHILGIDTYLIGKVGQDMFGHAIMESLRNFEEKLIQGMIVDPSVTTSYTIIISPPGIDRLFLHHPGANDTFQSQDIRLDQLSDAAIFHFGYPPVMASIYNNDGEALVDLYQRAKSTGITTSLDMCFPDPGSSGGKANWPEIFHKVLPYVDIFSPSIEEILFTLQKDLYYRLLKDGGSRFSRLISPDLLDEISQELLDLGVKIVLLKLGDQGAYLRTAGEAVLAGMGKSRPDKLEIWSNQQLWAPCYKVNVAGTTGSGDATIAGFLSALLRSLSPQEAINSAVAVGACNVEAPDAISGIKSWEMTQMRIADGWERHPLDLSDQPGWTWCEETRIWSKTT